MIFRCSHKTMVKNIHTVLLLALMLLLEGDRFKVRLSRPGTGGGGESELADCRIDL